jgi:hypothetical protein
VYIKRGAEAPPSNSVCTQKSGLSLFSLHHNLALVVELAFVPVGTVEHMRLSSSRTSAYVRSSSRVVSSTFARTRLTLSVFRMCHFGIFTNSLKRPTVGQ